MMRRCWIVGALALWVGGSGCTSTARRADGPSGLDSRIWGEAPAPPQRQVSLPPEREELPVGTTGPTGLLKYFPGLRRNPADAPSVATSSRPSWFAIGRRPKPTQVYMTDARSGLNQDMAEASALPVSIQVPSDRASDSAVTPAKAEKVATSPDLNAPTTAPDPGNSETASPPTEPVGSPMGAGGPEANPLLSVGDPGAGPSEPLVVNRMPEVPPVDPRERPRMSATTDPASPSAPKAQTSDGPKADGHALRAIPASPGLADSLESPELPILTAFFRKMGSTVRGTSHYHPTTIYASPQSLPSPQATPRPKVKPSPQVVPSPQVKPSGQVSETTHTCVCENCGAKIGKKPCLLRRMRKAIFQGETVAPSAQASH